MSADTPHGPWIDLHAHPGRCFLAGYDDTMPAVRQMGAAATVPAIRAAANAGVCCVSLSTVADLAVLRANSAGGLGAGRDFEAGEARADHDRQLAGLASVFDHVRQARTADDVLAAHEDGRGSGFVSCEGADFLDGEIGGLLDAHEMGTRMITLVHYRVNELGDIQTETPRHGGLTAFGRDVVTEMNRLGMIVDLAHATFETTVGALEVSTAPIVVSHSHLAGPGADHPRLLSDDHARVVADAGGLVGAWPAGVTATTLAEYVEEICRLVDLIGVNHVAIGSDLDANYRPVLTEYRQFGDVAQILSDRGFTAADVDAVLGGNVLRLFAEVCR